MNTDAVGTIGLELFMLARVAKSVSIVDGVHTEVLFETRGSLTVTGLAGERPLAAVVRPMELLRASGVALGIDDCLLLAPMGGRNTRHRPCGRACVSCLWKCALCGNLHHQLEVHVTTPCNPYGSPRGTAC